VATDAFLFHAPPQQLTPILSTQIRMAHLFHDRLHELGLGEDLAVLDAYSGLLVSLFTDGDLARKNWSGYHKGSCPNRLKCRKMKKPGDE
jgi:hypothetical protein